MKNANLETSSEKAYQALLKEILGGSLPKGEFLSQRMLAELADTSIISVREALKRLEHEFLLESIPKWGVRIPVETRTRIKNLYGIREALEVMVAYTLCKKNDQDVYDTAFRLADAIDKIDTEIPGNIDILSKKHRKLHLFLAESTGNQQLVTELQRLSLWSLLYQDPKNIWEVKQENWDNWHKTLIQEIFSTDVNKAQSAMHIHIQHGLEGDLIKFDEGFYD